MTGPKFFNSPEDVQWLLDTHLRGHDVNPFASFMLYGNEDAPWKVELYSDAHPLVGDAPDAGVIEFSDPY